MEQLIQYTKTKTLFRGPKIYVIIFLIIYFIAKDNLKIWVKIWETFWEFVN